MNHLRLLTLPLACLALVGCGADVPPDGGLTDAGRQDGLTPLDAPAAPDAAERDAAGLDAFTPPPPDTDCTPLPAPTGAVVRVDPSMAAALPSMVRSAAADTTFLLADGTYRTSGDEASRRIRVETAGITIRSESGNPDAVIVDGEYLTAEVLTVHASRVTLAELTITHAVDHCVHVTPYDGSADVVGFRMYRVRVLDCGEQFVKVNASGARDAWTDDGIVECSTFELSDAGRPHIERGTGGCYTGGIDAHSASGWIVRQNRFVGIYCAGEGLAEHAIHFWTASRDTLVERNVIIDCARGIGFGLVELGADRAYPDDPAPGLYVGHHFGIIRNNVIVADIPWYDTGIELDQARGTVVVHNSIIETPSATGSYSSIDTRFDHSITTVRNNLARRITVRGGVSTADHNVEMVPPSYFVDGPAGDAHLAATATEAIDRGIAIPEAGLDIDGDDHGAMPDIGADER